LLHTAEVLPAYEEFGIDKEKLEEILSEVVFGKKYLLESKPKEVEKEVKTEIAEEEKELNNFRGNYCYNDSI